MQKKIQSIIIRLYVFYTMNSLLPNSTTINCSRSKYRYIKKKKNTNDGI